jgi:putative membrane protein
MYGYQTYYPFHFLGGLVDFIFWVLVIWALIAIIRASRAGRLKNWRQFTGHDSALNLLKERYAKGEINKEEFDTKKKDLAS